MNLLFLCEVLLNGSRAVGVRYTHGETELEVQARREIVICAGAIESPKLLMLSGIGPRNHLENMGVGSHTNMCPSYVSMCLMSPLIVSERITYNDVPN